MEHWLHQNIIYMRTKDIEDIGNWGFKSLYSIGRALVSGLSWLCTKQGTDMLQL